MDSIENSMVITPKFNRPAPLDFSAIKKDILLTPFSSHEEFETAIIRNIDAAVNSKMFDYARMQSIATQSAIQMHNQWRRVYIQQNGDVPRIKKTKDGIEVDINVEGSQLNPEFLEFNYNMALFAATCILCYRFMTIEVVSAVIHRKWLMMSPWAKGGALDVSYLSLPEIEKEKDRDIFRIVSSFF